ncbi:54S ribosomal protein L37, mitochondrial-like [Impatiens glandulifera]|uniref:54S ribosomal protein L37, mitochondrial-like n=1 Tax=Impatiens glandulifera TaxID=253017 RepID=UPI001FB0DAA6|nr:54S ribosomal protein L37, mitochondrial-like [Impatiens glandulifera]XP_047333783.1 54S ribosomal protein L37, mitochondrial-like [Impatiens glandulifera]
MDMVSMKCIKQMRTVIPMRETVGMVWCRMFSAGSKKKGGKGAASADAPKVSILSKEVKSSTTIGCNTLKEGSDPKVMADSEYPDWLWSLLDKRTALSELKRKKVEDLPFEDLKRFAKLDNRARIKENNSAKAKS